MEDSTRVITLSQIMNNIQTAIQRTLNFISSVQQHPPPGDVPTTTYLKKKKKPLGIYLVMLQYVVHLLSTNSQKDHIPNNFVVYLLPENPCICFLKKTL